uniref:Uncharacterized protein n=1 Tax=Knipowitschia caucasica TaxID=637954 RepID=A0AAV2M1W6_KNICA
MGPEIRRAISCDLQEEGLVDDEDEDIYRRNGGLFGDHLNHLDQGQATTVTQRPLQILPSPLDLTPPELGPPSPLDLTPLDLTPPELGPPSPLDLTPPPPSPLLNHYGRSPVPSNANLNNANRGQQRLLQRARPASVHSRSSPYSRLKDQGWKSHSTRFTGC